MSDTIINAGGDYTARRPAGFDRTTWLAGVVLGVLATIGLYLCDAQVNGAMQGVREQLSGDVRREWQALQQYGQGSLTALILAVVWIMDRDRRARVLDFGVAAALVGVTTFGAKILIGRGRPVLGDPHLFVGVLGTHAVETKHGGIVAAHSWEAAGAPQLWSMPSSHTAWAVMMSMFLTMLYPRLWTVALLMAVIVGTGRLVFDAHWGSDVAAGATMAWAAGYPALAGGWGRVLMKRR